MHVFGSKCWYVLPKKQVKKLDARAREGMFVGYSENSKGYKVWDAITGKMLVSRDVRFDESNEEVTVGYDSPKDNAKSIRKSSCPVKVDDQSAKRNSSNRVTENVQSDSEESESSSESDSDGAETPKS